MTFEEALVFVDSVLKPGYLNQVQELVLRQSWEGRTYLEIAIDSCYDAEYIKNVGYHLWHLLSQRLGEKVTHKLEPKELGLAIVPSAALADFSYYAIHLNSRMSNV